MGLTHQQLQGIIETHQAKSGGERRRWDSWRRWYVGHFWQQALDAPSGAYQAEMGTDSDDINFETNYPYAYIDTMVANVCPTNPRVTVIARKNENGDQAKIREALVNDLFYRQRMHKSLWSMATSTALCGRSFIKTVWSFVRNTVEFRVVDPRYIFFDMSATRWDDIRYLIEVTVLTKAEFQKRVKKPGKKGGFYSRSAAKDASFGGYPGWLRDLTGERSLLNDASKDVFNWVTIYEFYDFENKKYYHIMRGQEEPLFSGDLPYANIANPFTMLTFNENMKDLGGLSDISLISSLQQRLNELDTLELWHAQSSIPVTLLQSSLVDNPEAIMTAVRDATEPGSVIAVHGKAEAPIGSLFGSTPTPSLTPSFTQMRDRAQGAIEFILGVPQYSRGVVGVTDIATEVALADSATRTRNGRRIKAVTDVLDAVAKKTVGLFAEFLDAATSISIRLVDTQEVMEVTRETIGPLVEDGLGYDYESSPYSPAENNRLTQIRNLQAFLPILQQSPAINNDRLITKLADLLNMREVLVSPEEKEEAQAQQMQQMAQMQGAQAPPEGTPQAAVADAPAPDTTQTGALPPGLEPPPLGLSAGGAGSRLPNILRGE